MGWWVADLYQAGKGMELVSWAFWVVFSITLHELAHGWAALWQGDDTPVRYNRMTLNPVVHLGWYSLVIFALIGIAWGMMPTDPSKYRWRRQGRIVVAGAGPAMNIILALVALTAAAFWNVYGQGQGALSENVRIFLFTGGMLNIVLALFNLLPVPPLDGSSILAGASFRMYRLYQHPNVSMFGMLFILLIFFSGIGGIFFGTAVSLGRAYISVFEIILP